MVICDSISIAVLEVITLAVKEVGSATRQEVQAPLCDRPASMET